MKNWIVNGVFNIIQDVGPTSFNIFGCCILEDPGAVSRVDKMFVVKVFCKIDLTENFHHEHFIDPNNCPWASEDVVAVEIAPTSRRQPLGYLLEWPGGFWLGTTENKSSKWPERDSSETPGPPDCERATHSAWVGHTASLLPRKELVTAVVANPEPNSIPYIWHNISCI